MRILVINILGEKKGNFISETSGLIFHLKDYSLQRWDLMKNENNWSATLLCEFGFLFEFYFTGA